MPDAKGVRNGCDEMDRHVLEEKQRKHTIEATILLKIQVSHRNEAKKYLITKELIGTRGLKSRKVLN